MKIGLMLRELHRSESDLAFRLRQLSERHKAEHEIYHLAQDLAAWSQSHVREIAGVAARFGESLDAETRGPGFGARLREKGSELVGSRPEPALLLLVDLREIYTMASGVSADWEMLAQAAQGTKDAELLAVTERCHPETLRQVRWANAQLKESSTQILVS